MSETISDRARGKLNELRNAILPVLYDPEKSKAERRDAILALFVTGDEFNMDKFGEEETAVKRILLDPKVVFSNERISDPEGVLTGPKEYTNRELISSILQETQKANNSHCLPIKDISGVQEEEVNPNLVMFFHLLCMELSRAETEAAVLAAISTELQTLLKFQQTIKPFILAYAKHCSRIQKLNVNLTDSTANKNPEIAPFLASLDEKLAEEINIWAEIKKIKLANIELTNDGIHVLETDTTAMRFADRMTPEILRTMENLTKLWTKYVDPALGLPPRDGETTNPYSRTISAALAFLGIEHITTGQIVDRADRYFKPQTCETDEVNEEASVLRQGPEALTPHQN